jgi:hypothetical protein
MNTKKSNMRRKALNIQFADHDTVYEIQHVNDMNDEELSAVFWSEAELQELRQDCRALVSMIDEGLHIWNGKELFDIRGLQAHSKTYTRRAHKLRDSLYHLINAVQGSALMEDDVSIRIAQLSRRVSAISTEIALATAMEDHRAVRSTDFQRSSEPRDEASSSMSKETQAIRLDSPQMQIQRAPRIIRRRTIDIGRSKAI